MTLAGARHPIRRKPASSCHLAGTIANELPELAARSRADCDLTESDNIGGIEEEPQGRGAARWRKLMPNLWGLVAMFCMIYLVLQFTVWLDKK
jgi:hypothetical protein